MLSIKTSVIWWYQLQRTFWYYLPRKQEIVTITPQIKHLLESVLTVIPRIHKCFSLSNLICVVLADRHNCLVNWLCSLCCVVVVFSSISISMIRRMINLWIQMYIENPEILAFCTAESMESKTIIGIFWYNQWMLLFYNSLTLYPFIVLRSVRGRGGVDNKPLKNNYD
jgi:hypothetical protein